ncbi:MAG TPA: hypothetical protein VFU81_09960 [Thermomicrobiales bacterium]|nr:hypothetical protein [Thermomicrobiales bacterium]
MDRREFDRIARAMARGTSRRRALGMLAGAAAAIVGAGAARAQMTPGIDPGGLPQFVCGGSLGAACPDGYECAPAAGSDGVCDPAADPTCPGVCVLSQPSSPCAAMRCKAGTVCCDQCGGICLPAGMICGTLMCIDKTCGDKTCGPGEYCCNKSCGICAPMGAMCIQMAC